MKCLVLIWFFTLTVSGQLLTVEGVRKKESERKKKEIQEKIEGARTLPFTGETVTVLAEAGDTVSSLAVRYSVDPADVASFNGLLINSSLADGREVKLPLGFRIGSESKVDLDLKETELQTEADEKRKQEVREWESRWKLVATTATKPATNWYFRTSDRRRDDNVEVWLKIVPPTKERIFGRGKSAIHFAYMLQFYVFHCDDKRYSVESALIFGTSGKPVSVPSFLFRFYREPINPDSVNEGLWRYFCH